MRSIDRDSGTDWTLAKDTMAFVPFLVREGIFTGKSIPIDSGEAAIRKKLIEARADIDESALGLGPQPENIEALTQELEAYRSEKEYYPIRVTRPTESSESEFRRTIEAYQKAITHNLGVDKGSLMKDVVASRPHFQEHYDHLLNSFQDLENQELTADNVSKMSSSYEALGQDLEMFNSDRIQPAVMSSRNVRYMTQFVTRHLQRLKQSENYTSRKRPTEGILRFTS